MNNKLSVLIIFTLASHIAEVGIVGPMVIVLLTALNGVTKEHQIGHAFEEALPFTARLVIFFSIVAVIHDQRLVSPTTNVVLSMDVSQQAPMLFVANGILLVVMTMCLLRQFILMKLKQHLIRAR